MGGPEWSAGTFHPRCGQRVVLSEGRTVARRSLADFNCGLVFSSTPLEPGRPFIVRIDSKVNTWSGSIEVGATALDPDLMAELPLSATDLAQETFVMSGGSVLKDGHSLLELYGTDLDTLQEGDTVGVLLNHQGELEFLVNGESQGVAEASPPPRLFALVDIYGKCVQVSVVQPPLSSLSGPRPDRLRFHTRCGHLIKLTNGQRTAERRRPLDEFNNGVVLTHRPLLTNELFEIRIEKLVAKWSGSIEVGVTSHAPETLALPATMTNLRSGTTMMSGCGILTNGQGTRREYGHFNLDELREGDTIGIVRRPNHSLHYFINGMDQGVAVHDLRGPIWGVIDLYGMTVKVSIVDQDSAEQPILANQADDGVEEEFESSCDSLTFHRRCGSNAAVINGGRTAHRPNALEDFNNGVVLTSRFLQTGELFEVRLEQMVKKWAGSIEVGVTTHRPQELDFPSTMTNVRSGTWMMTGNGVMHNGTTVLDDYGHNLDRLGVGDRVGVMRLADGTLHFYVNGTDQGVAATGVPEAVYGVIDLYGQASRASIVSRQPVSAAILPSEAPAPSTRPLRFHNVHGKNASISTNGFTASRPRAYGEFNDAIVVTNRPLGDGELFEVLVEHTVDRWSGSIEVGVTRIRPEELEFPSTMTDIDHDSWMLSGSSVMQNGSTVRNGYRCDLDTVRAGNRIGVVRHANGNLHFYLNGEDQGIACQNVPSGIYGVIDLYGQCSQVTISNPREGDLEDSVDSIPPGCHSPAKTSAPPILKHQFSSKCSSSLTLRNNNLNAQRLKKSHGHALLFSSKPLEPDSVFEVIISEESPSSSGCLSVGATSLDLDLVEAVPGGGGGLADVGADTWFVSGSQVQRNHELLKPLFCPNLQWLVLGDRIGLRLTAENSLRLLLNNEDLGEIADSLPKRLYAVFDVFGRTEGLSILSEGAAAPDTAPRAAPEDARFLCSDWLHHSLEVASGGGMHTSSTLSSPMAPPPALEGPAIEMALPPLAFHERHGRNIKLSNSRATAQRIASYNQGVVVGAHPLTADLIFQFRVDRVNSRWTSSVALGVTSQSPESLSVPVAALALRKETWVISSDGVFFNGDKIGECGEWSLGADPQAGQVLGLMVDVKGNLRLFLDHKDVGILAKNVPPNCYPLIDVYGQCEQVTILEYNSMCVRVPEKEKAEYEGEEKEDSLASLRYIDQSISEDSLLLQSIVLARANTCEYLELCSTFKRQLGLPDGFFADSQVGVCYCEVCEVASEKGDTSSHPDFWPPRGWCAFELRRRPTATSSSWHTAFVQVAASRLRRCLDRGSPPLPAGGRALALAPNIESTAENASHKIFFDFGSRCKYKSQVGFELLIQPGSYQVSGTDLAQRWSTKEKGNLLLTSLLLRLQPLQV
ncbi:neuralized-like protein 4 [Neocloeon triangulifer]|uniref:neuralized-like protein 4 n=1 Tax=Neocloeon triangulifer TaxID=2078957 RepID=UPI00286EDBF2|nr:neuralized-like protein 4 [Neocloeon triangulifer]